MSDKLKQALEKLRDELKKANPDHPAALKLSKDVSAALENGRSHLPAIDSLRETAEALEVRYPDLTALINNVMTSLSNIGI